MNNWYKLRLAGLTRGEMYKLMLEFDNFDELIDANMDIISLKLKIKKEKLIKIKEINDIMLSDEKRKYDEQGIEIISLKEKDYPFLLKQISNPPVFLYLKGNTELLKKQKTMGIVGTRRMTDYGKSATEKFTGELVDIGATIVSGLALGVDAVALGYTLAKSGSAIAVVGSGLDVIYPGENRKLWKRLENEGLIISEYPLGTKPLQWNFPERNRIIIGLSKGVLITESFAAGGALISGKLCLEESRELFAVPGFISYPSFEGCNNLIKSGEAKLVSEIFDICEELNWTAKKDDTEEEMVLDISKEEEQIYGRLLVEKSLDNLILETGMSATDLLVYLTEMEIKGLVRSISGGKYVRN